ncbi:MAG: sulfurtransferase complex subunit TusD [Pseudohongiellaceae bacterium]|jgi:tRNA 2-thiouridine synthesizing protein D
MSSFAIIVRGAPYSSQAALSAWHFCTAVLAEGHSIQRLFFYEDGVLNASAAIVPPQDELHLPRAWQQLIQQNGIDAVVCVSSALKRGVVDASEAERYGLAAASLLPGFVIGGLGQLVESCVQADRVISFAA